MRSACCAAILAGIVSIAVSAQGTVAGEWMVTLHEPDA